MKGLLNYSFNYGRADDDDDRVQESRISAGILRIIIGNRDSKSAAGPAVVDKRLACCCVCVNYIGYMHTLPRRYITKFYIYVERTVYITAHTAATMYRESVIDSLISQA